MRDKVTFIVKKNNQNYYYITVEEFLAWDFNIAKYLHISEPDYQTTLIKKFKGFRNKQLGGDVFFKNQQEAERALEWVNSIYLTEVLTGGTDEKDNFRYSL